MKHNRILCLLLALCLLGSTVWYGSIAVLQRGSQVALQYVEGDSTALEGIRLHGSLTDDTFSQDFTIENGVVTNHFVPHPSPNLSSNYRYTQLSAFPAPGSHCTKPYQVQQADPDAQTWIFSTDRVHLQMEYTSYQNGKAGCASVDTGIELQGKPEEFEFELSYHPDDDYSFWYPRFWLDDILPSLSQNKLDSYSAVIGDSTYLALNLPWGGVQLYRIDEIEEQHTNSIPNLHARSPEELLEYPEAFDSIGSCQLLAEYPASQFTCAVGLMPLGDRLVLLTQSRADIPCLVLDENKTLQQCDPPEKNQIAAQLCETNGHVLDSTVLLDLPDDVPYSIQSMQCVTAETGFDDLALILNIRTPDSLYASVQAGSSFVHAQAAAALRMESDRFSSVQTAVFPSIELSRGANLEYTDDRLANLAAVQPDETGTKMALVWQSPIVPNPDYKEFTGGDLWLDVLRDGNVLYRGMLESDWKDDSDMNVPLFSSSRIGKTVDRKFAFDVISRNTEDINRITLQCQPTQPDWPY